MGKVGARPRVCIECGVTFVPERVPAGGYSRRKTCSIECQMRHRKGEFQKHLITSRTCEVCGKSFAPKRFKDGRMLSRARACSYPCQQVLRGAPVWSPAEENHLASLVGDVPPPLLHQRYNLWASCNGYPKRSKSAVIIRAQRYGSMRPIGDWLDSGTAAQMLGVGPATVDKWLRLGFLKPSENIPTVTRYFKREQLVELTQSRPHLFGGLDKDNLFDLLEDWDAVYAILSRYPRRPNEGRPVVNIQTAQRYPNRAAAARAIGVNKSALLRALQKGTHCQGHQWVWVDQIQRRRA